MWRGAPAILEIVKKIVRQKRWFSNQDNVSTLGGVNISNSHGFQNVKLITM